MSTSASQVPAEERQVNLLLALRHSATGMSALDVIEQVAGYDPRGGASARRMFERDKDVLRRIGVPVVVSGDADEPRYRVEEDDYALPPLRLGPDEVAALELAASAWRDGSLPVPARRALTKLLAVAPSRRGGDLVGLRADLGGEEVPRELLTAVEDRRRVRLTYLSASSGTTRERVVEPYGLRRTEGAWYLDARDTQVPRRLDGQAGPGDDGRRTFRLSRVVGEVRGVGEAGAFEVPDDALTRRSGTAVLALAPGRAIALRLRSRETAAPEGSRVPEGWDVVGVVYEDLLPFAGDLAALADAVVVLGPPALREAVLAHLCAVAALGGDADRPGEER